MRRRGAGAAPLALLGLALLACGGGGSGGGSDATAEITADNSEAITSEVLLGLELSAEESTLPAGIALSQVGPALASAAAPVALVAATPSLAGSVSLASSTAIGPTTEDCAAGGSVTFSGTRAELDVPSVGDRMSFAYDQCDDGGSAPVLDGSLDYVIVALAGDLTGDLFAVRLDVTFGNFVQTTAAEQVAADGAATTSYDARTPPQKKSFIAGPMLSLRKDSRTVELLNFDNSLIQDSGADGVDGHGLLASLDSPPVFDGQVAYDTVTPITDGHADDTVDDELAAGEFIVGGDLLITGVGGASIRLVEQTDPNVELLVDLDGDGEPEGDCVTTWDALLDPSGAFPACPAP
jgi:hypothetical protein